MTRIRTFVALEVSAEVRRRASAVITQLQSAHAAVRWVRPENLHVTLKFLGDVNDAEVYGVCRAVGRAVAGHEPFAVKCVSAGAFPSAERPRTVWLGVDDPAERVVALQSDVEAELFELGFVRELRPYRPHITIGRIAHFRRGPELGEALNELSGKVLGEFAVSSCVVFSSELRGEGPIYTAMGRYALGSGASM